MKIVTCYHTVCAIDFRIYAAFVSITFDLILCRYRANNDTYVCTVLNSTKPMLKMYGIPCIHARHVSIWM